jgi:hypothetical protein
LGGKNVQPIDSKDFTDEKERDQKNHFDTKFDSILQKHPELARLIAAWPNIPKNYREAIISTVESAKTLSMME